MKPPLIDNIPHELKALDRWLVWEYRSLRGGGKPTKVPVGLDDGGRFVPIDAHNPGNWLTFEAAVALIGQHEQLGLGFDIAAQDGIEGIDIDGCIDEAGEIAGDAQEIIGFAQSYTERSPSGRGIRILGYGPALEKGERRVSTTRGGFGIERYTDRRFLTITGNVVSALPVAPMAELRELLDGTYFKRQPAKPRATAMGSDPEHDAAVARHCLPLIGSATATDYTGWLKVGSALAVIGGESMLDDFLRWSSQAANYDEDDARRKFDHLVSSCSWDAKQAVGTLTAIAEQDSGTSIAAIVAEASNSLGRDHHDYAARTITARIGGKAIGSNAEPEAERDIEELELPEPDALGYRPFPLDALPAVLRDFVGETAPAMCADAGGLSLLALGAASAAIGTTRRLRIKRSWDCYPIMWAGLVADSGELKTPVLEAAVEPIKARQSAIMLEHAKALAEFEAADADFKDALSDWQAARKRGGKDPVGDKPQPPERPRPRRIWTADATTEALVAMLADNARGAVVISDELVGFLGSFDRYKKGSGDEGFFLSAHNGVSFTADRKTGDRPSLHVKRAAVSIIGGIQPGRAVEELGSQRRQSGLVPRFLFAMPPRRPYEWSDAEPSAVTLSRYAAAIGRLYDLEPALDADGNDTPVVLELSPEARRAFIGWTREHAKHSRHLTGDIKAAMSKLREVPARLSIVFHELAAVSGGAWQPEPSRIVSLESMLPAIEIARWFRHEAERVYRLLEAPPSEAATLARRDALGATILETLWERGRLTRRELAEALTGLGSGEDIVAALAELQARGAVVREAEGSSDAWTAPRAEAPPPPAAEDIEGAIEL